MKVSDQTRAPHGAPARVRAKGLWNMVRNRMRREGLYSRPEYWDAKAAEYDGLSVGMWPNAHLNGFYHREQMEWFARHFPPLAGKRVLDVGCSTGRLSRELASQGAVVTGIDFSARSIEVARRSSGGANPSYRVQSVFDIAEESAYDLVVVLGVLTVACTSRAQVGMALRRLYSALSPGGQILIVEPIHRGPLHRVLDLDKDEFLAEMRAAGFALLEVRDLHFWPARLALAYVQWPALLTRLGYLAGQSLMRALPLSSGDYKAIAARRPG